MRSPAHKRPMPAGELLAAFLAYLDQVGGALVGGFREDIGELMAERELVPNALPCLACLPRAAAIAGAAERKLVELLARHAPALRWGQTYSAADFGQRFLDNYGWIELFGLRGHFASTRIAGGFLLLGPQTDYPDHHHEAEEVYVPLTGGALWRMGEGPFAPRAAGEVIYHPSNVAHAMRTGMEPLLAIYLWRGGKLDQKSVIS